MTIEHFENFLKKPFFLVAHGITDGFYLSGSLVTYGSGCLAADSNATLYWQKKFYEIHHLEFAISEMLFFLLYSSLAQYANIHKQNHYLNYLRITWPYFRDFISGLKNGRSATLNPASLHPMTSSLYHIVNPIGIAVGIVLAFNLVWYRYMKEQREKMIKHNECLLNGENISYTLDDIQRHSVLQKSANYASATLDGLTDGFYLYGCLFTLIGLGTTGLGGAALIAAIAVIAVISTWSLLTKLEEEYQYQKRLEESQLKAEIKWLTAFPDKGNLLQQKQDQLQRLTQPLDLEKYHFFIKSLFLVGRAILCGAKNAKSAVSIFSAYCKQKLMLIVMAGILSTAYALYLGGEVTVRQVKQSNMYFKTQGLFSNKARETIQPQENQREEEDANVGVK